MPVDRSDFRRTSSRIQEEPRSHPMLIPLQIIYRNVAQSIAVDAAVRRCATRLDRYYEHVGGCRVLVEATAPQQHASGFNVEVRLRLPPRDEIVVTAQPRHDDLAAAVREAFAAVGQRL